MDTAVQHLVTLQTQLTSEAGSGDLARLGAVSRMIMIVMFMMIMMMIMIRCGLYYTGSPVVSTAC